MRNQRGKNHWVKYSARTWSVSRRDTASVACIYVGQLLPSICSPTKVQGTHEKPFQYYRMRSERNIRLLQDPNLDTTEIDSLLTPENSDLAQEDISVTDPLMMFIDPLLLQSLWLRLWLAAEKPMRKILDRDHYRDILAYFPQDGNREHGVGCPYNELLLPDPKLHGGNNSFGNALRQMFHQLRTNAVPTVLVVIDCCDTNEVEIRTPDETPYRTTVMIIYLTNAYATFCISLLEALTSAYLTDVLLECGTRDKPDEGLNGRGRVRMVSTLSKLGNYLLEYPNLRRFTYLGTSEVRHCTLKGKWGRSFLMGKKVGDRCMVPIL